MKPLLKPLIMALLIYLAATPVYSQGGDLPTASPQDFNNALQFDHLTVVDGLSSNQVLTILQDCTGFFSDNSLCTRSQRNYSLV